MPHERPAAPSSRTGRCRGARGCRAARRRTRRPPPRAPRRSPPRAYAATPHHSDDARGQRLRRGDQISSSSTLSSLQCASRRSPGPKTTLGMPARLVERARRTRRRSRPGAAGSAAGSLVPADALVRAHHRLHERMLPRRRRRRPVVDPLEARRVLAQPRVEPARGEHVAPRSPPAPPRRVSSGGYQSEYATSRPVREVEGDVEARIGVEDAGEQREEAGHEVRVALRQPPLLLELLQRRRRSSPPSRAR